MVLVAYIIIFSVSLPHFFLLLLFFIINSYLYTQIHLGELMIYPLGNNTSNLSCFTRNVSFYPLTVTFQVGAE